MRTVTISERAIDVNRTYLKSRSFQTWGFGLRATSRILIFSYVRNTRDSIRLKD
jgi:hypothetical protein